MDLTGLRGCIDLGVRLNATVFSALTTRRRRNHRMDIYNIIESAIEEQRHKLATEANYSVWKQYQDKYQSVFRTKNTWNLLRQEGNMVDWYKWLWFMYHTPSSLSLPGWQFRIASPRVTVCLLGTQVSTRRVSSAINRKLVIIYLSHVLTLLQSGHS